MVVLRSYDKILNWANETMQCLELILGIQSIVSLAVLALQRFMMVTRDRQVRLPFYVDILVVLKNTSKLLL